MLLWPTSAGRRKSPSPIVKNKCRGNAAITPGCSRAFNHCNAKSCDAVAANSTGLCAVATATSQALKPFFKSVVSVYWLPKSYKYTRCKHSAWLHPFICSRE